MFENLAIVCEITFLVCFGASWPFNIIKAYKARTTKGIVGRYKIPSVFF